MNISNFSSEALKEELQRREVHTGDSDDDSLYSDPRAVTSQSKKRHRSASPDLLDDDANARPARRNATDVTSRNETHIEGMKARRTKLVVTQEEKDFDLASKLQADEAASSLNSQKQLTQKQLTDPRFGTKSRPIDVDRMRSPFQGRTTATKDFDPQDLALEHQANFDEQTRWSPWGSLFNVAQLPAICVPWPVRDHPPVGVHLGSLTLDESSLLGLAQVLHP